MDWLMVISNDNKQKKNYVLLASSFCNHAVLVWSYMPDYQAFFLWREIQLINLEKLQQSFNLTTSLHMPPRLLDSTI